MARSSAGGLSAGYWFLGICRCQIGFVCGEELEKSSRLNLNGAHLNLIFFTFLLSRARIYNFKPNIFFKPRAKKFIPVSTLLFDKEVPLSYNSTQYHTYTPNTYFSKWLSRLYLINISFEIIRIKEETKCKTEILQQQLID